MGWWWWRSLRSGYGSERGDEMGSETVLQKRLIFQPETAQCTSSLTFKIMTDADLGIDSDDELSGSECGLTVEMGEIRPNDEGGRIFLDPGQVEELLEWLYDVRWTHAIGAAVDKVNQQAQTLKGIPSTSTEFT